MRCPVAETPAAAVSPAGVLQWEGADISSNADIYFTVQERNWEQTCRAVGKPQWIDDPAYNTAKARETHIFEDLRRDRELACRQDQVRGGRPPAHAPGALCARAEHEGVSCMTWHRGASGMLVEVQHRVRRLPDW